MTQHWNNLLRAMPFSGTSAADRKEKSELEGVSVFENLPRMKVSLEKDNDIATGKDRYPNRYPTSIFGLISACNKMSRITELPPGRRVYRGLGGLTLGEQWFENNSRGVRSGVELAFMSTTENMSVALQYSGVRRGEVGSVFEFDVGAIDCGARLNTLSQYPGPMCSLCSSKSVQNSGCWVVRTIGRNDAVL